MSRRLWQVVGLCLAVAVVSAFTSPAQAQVSCSGVAAFASCTAYASGAKVVYNNTLYHSIASIPSTRDCPPNSPYNPSNDNWWVNDGTCSSTSTATATATRTNTPTATRTPTATATGATATRTNTATATRTATATSSTATATRTNTATATSATATRTNTATATRTNTATATATSNTGGGNCASVPAFQSCTAYASGAQVVYNNTLYHSLAPIPSTRDCPPNSPFNPSNDNWWQNDGACTGGTATPTATRTPTATPTGSTPTPTSTACNPCTSNTHKLVGYWHNWDTPVAVRLKDVNPLWDIIVVAFADNSGDSFTFTPAASPGTATDFINDMALLHAAGKKVIVSGGGALNTPSIGSSSTCANSIVAMMDKWGFDGFDVDFENGGVFLNSGDNDVNNPTTPNIVNLANCLNSVKSQRANAILTLAPIANYMQAGYQYYGPNGGASNWNGAYLPVYAKAANSISYVWPQYYNECNIMGLDGLTHCEGTIDNLVQMTNMMISGFGIMASGGRTALSHFNGMPASKALMGVPASAGASPGYMSNADLQSSFNQISPMPNGYMTWSINWDVYNGSVFSSGMGPFLHSK